MVAGSWRTGILVIVVATLAVGGIAVLLAQQGSSPRATRTTAAARPADVAVTNILPDPRALEHVVVAGATSDEAAAVHDLLPLLGPDTGIDRVTFTDGTAAGTRRLVITQPTGDPQRAWLGDVFARNVVARLRDRGETIAAY